MTTWPGPALPGPCLGLEISVSGNLEYLNLLLISHDSVPAAGWLARAGRGSGSGATQSRADLASCSSAGGLDRGLHVVTWEDSEKYFLKFLHCMDQLIIQYQGRQGAAECQYTWHQRMGDQDHWPLTRCDDVTMSRCHDCHAGPWSRGRWSHRPTLLSSVTPYVGPLSHSPF